MTHKYLGSNKKVLILEVGKFYNRNISDNLKSAKFLSIMKTTIDARMSVRDFRRKTARIKGDRIKE